MFETSQALQKPAGTKKLKSKPFNQYSWSSEVESTWTSLIHWPYRTSSMYVLLWPQGGGDFMCLHYISLVPTTNDGLLFKSFEYWIVWNISDANNEIGKIYYSKALICIHISVAWKKSCSSNLCNLSYFKARS